MDCN